MREDKPFDHFYRFDLKNYNPPRKSETKAKMPKEQSNVWHLGPSVDFLVGVQKISAKILIMEARTVKTSLTHISVKLK